jgi:hypothetical protein
MRLLWRAQLQVLPGAQLNVLELENPKRFTMYPTFKLPPFIDAEVGLRSRLEEAGRIRGRSAASLLGRLDKFVDRTMRNLVLLDGKPPLKGYAQAFDATLSQSIKTTGKNGRALLRSFLFPYWQIFHLRFYPRYLPTVLTEKCRTAYLSDSDVGALVAANKDDPLGDFKPDSRPPPAQSETRVWYDGAGSGLHIDEEPPGFFPVDYRTMMDAVSRTARDVPDAVEMLEHLSPHWGRGNVLLIDREKRSARIDKCSFHRFAARVNTGSRAEHISGMVCFDPGYKAYQRSLREAYLESVQGTWDGYEGAAFDANDLKDRVLDEGLRKLETDPTYDGLLDLLTCHDRPGYLCKHGDPVQPGEPAPREYTLLRVFWLIDRKECHRWQWDAEKNLPTCQAPREVYPCEMFAS